MTTGTWAALVAVLVVTSSCSPRFHWQFRKVEAGMTEPAVLALLGPPDETGTEFHLSQRESFEAVYEAALQSGSSHWLFWYRGIDLTYAVGFDPSGSVRFAAVGGT